MNERKTIDDIIAASDIAEFLSDSLQIRRPRGYISEFEDRPFIYQDYLNERNLKDSDKNRIDYYMNKNTYKSKEDKDEIQSKFFQLSAPDFEKFILRKAKNLIERDELIQDDRFHERLYQDELTNPMNPNYRMQELPASYGGNVETGSAKAPSFLDLLKVAISRRF